MKRGLPLRARLLLGASVFVAILAAILLVYLPEKLDQIAMRGAHKRGEAVAALIGGAVTPGLAFDDEDAITSALMPMAKTPDAVYGTVYAMDGEKIARYPADGPQVPPAKDLYPKEMRSWVSNSTLHISQPIAGRDGPIGRLQVGFSLDWAEAAQQENRQVALTFTALLAAGLYAGLLLLGLVLTRPVLRLTRLSHLVAKGHLEQIEIEDLQDNSKSRDELTRLNHTFYTMLQKLRESRAALKDQISEAQAQRRTAEEQRERAQMALAVLKKTQDQLVKSEKLASLGHLVAGIAHEINTPLGAITASAEILNTHMTDALQTSMGPYSALSEAQQTLVIEVLKESADAPQLRGREARNVRREIAQGFAGVGIANPRETASALIDLGYSSQVPFWTDLAARTDADVILKVASPLAVLLRNAHNIGSATTKAKKIVTALKTFARTNIDEVRAPVDLRRSVQTVLTLYQHHLKSGVEVDLDIQEGLIVQGDNDALTQVWTNLIHNAIQAMKGTGNIQINGQALEQHAVLRFRNNGPPIPADVVPRIFEPFFTTKPEGEGTGLGLDIVRQIVEAHAGVISVQSTEDWTEFTVKIRFEALQV
jgi:two-component system NtrC family sensor kinase